MPEVSVILEMVVQQLWLALSHNTMNGCFCGEAALKGTLVLSKTWF